MSDTTEVHPVTDARSTAADPTTAADPPAADPPAGDPPVLDERPAEASRAAAPVPGGAAPGDAAGTPGEAAGTPGEASRPLWRRILAYGITTLAALLVFVSLVMPNQPNHLALGWFVRIPVEALFGAVVLLVLPARLRTVAAVFMGVGLGLLTILKLFDMGFYEVLARQFDPVLDYSLLGDAVDVVRRSVGNAGAIATEVGAVLLGAAILVLTALSMLRLGRLMNRHRTTSVRGVMVAAVVWAACFLLGVQIVPGLPIASRTAAGLTYYRIQQMQADVNDRKQFAAAAGIDAFQNTPGPDLLTGLRGKDVMITFVESYGRVALQDPELGPPVSALLDDGYRQLTAAGYAARSGWLTSSTAGGSSWLAHSTLLSGLWIGNQQRYRTLLASNRFTLNEAFSRAGWRTVTVETAIKDRAWPEGSFYHYNELYTSQDLGYKGPLFNFSSVPDQFTLEAFQRAERDKPHSPLMAELVLLSSHTPWAPLPKMVDWNDLGDGSVFTGVKAGATSTGAAWSSRDKVRTAYMQSIEYTLNSLISYVQRYGDDNLVMVFLGDHQPAPLITGDGAGHDVPITIVAKDRTVLDRISSWNWQEGLRPAANTPVWKMDAFRDRFLTAFGPSPAH